MNNFLQKMAGALLSLILPKPADVLALEALTPDELMESLPSARTLSDTQTALFDYKDARVKTIVWEIKYRGNKKLTESMATLLYDTILADCSDAVTFGKHKLLLVPVPASRERMHSQGFNQCELLAAAILRIDSGTHFVFTPALSKVHTTERQSHIKKRNERLANLRDSFTASGDVHGQNIILIDDVITTGATVSEATRALKEAGAKSVQVYAIAH